MQRPTLIAIASDRAENPIALGWIMSADDGPVTVLSEDECWSLLSSMSLGRLVTILGGKPEIFPVNFATQRRTVLFRTAEGTKLYSAVMGDWVAFEADYHDPPLTYGWSVIVKGTAHLLSATADILDAEEAPLRPWIATLKPRYVRVIPLEITGRRFKFGPEPDHETIIGSWLLPDVAAKSWHDCDNCDDCGVYRSEPLPDRIAGQWRAAAQQAVDSQGGEQLDQLRADAADRLAEIQERVQAIMAEVHIDADMFDLPPIPELPAAELDGDGPDPLLDSRWDFAEQCRRLIESKQYTNGE